MNLFQVYRFRSNNYTNTIQILVPKTLFIFNSHFDIFHQLYLIKELPIYSKTKREKQMELDKLISNVKEDSKASNELQQKLKESIELITKIETADLLLRIANVHKEQENFEEAETYYRDSITIYKQIDEPSCQLKIAYAFDKLAGLSRKESNYKAALKFYRKSLEIILKTSPLDHENIANSKCRIAEVYIELRNYNQALEIIFQAIEIRNKQSPTNHNEFFRCILGAGVICISLGKQEEALSYLKRALDQLKYVKQPEFLSDPEEFREAIEDAIKYILGKL